MSDVSLRSKLPSTPEDSLQAAFRSRAAHERLARDMDTILPGLKQKPVASRGIWRDAAYCLTSKAAQDTTGPAIRISTGRIGGPDHQQAGQPIL